jgi:hypothetical protein
MEANQEKLELKKKAYPERLKGKKERPSRRPINKIQRPWCCTTIRPCPMCENHAHTHHPAGLGFPRST